MQEKGGRGVVRITSVMFLVYGLFLMFLMLFVGRGIVFLLPSGWVLIALCVLCVAQFLLGSRYRKMRVGAKVLRVLSIATLAVAALATVLVSVYHLVCAVLAVLNLVATGKKRAAKTD